MRKLSLNELPKDTEFLEAFSPEQQSYLDEFEFVEAKQLNDDFGWDYFIQVWYADYLEGEYDPSSKTWNGYPTCLKGNTTWRYHE